MAYWLDQQGVDFIQFAFRWVNCLLVRELPFSLGIRLWDTYIAEGSSFNEFLVRHLIIGNALGHWDTGWCLMHVIEGLGGSPMDC